MIRLLPGGCELRRKGEEGGKSEGGREKVEVKSKESEPAR
jgi:hypothetical protein